MHRNQLDHVYVMKYRYDMNHRIIIIMKTRAYIVYIYINLQVGIWNFDCDHNVVYHYG